MSCDTPIFQGFRTQAAATSSQGGVKKTGNRIAVLSAASWGRHHDARTARYPGRYGYQTLVIGQQEADLGMTHTGPVAH